MEGDGTSRFPWGIICLSDKTITSHCAVMNNITWNNAYIWIWNIWKDEKSIPMYDKWTAKKQAWHQKLFSLVLQLSHQRLVVKTQNLSAPDVWIWAQTQPFEAMWKQKELRSQPSQPANLKSVNIYTALWGRCTQTSRFWFVLQDLNKLSSTSTWYHPQTRKGRLKRKDVDTTTVNNIERTFPNSQQEYSQSCLLSSIWIACSK